MKKCSFRILKKCIYLKGHLSRKYNDEFSLRNWHGNLSLQRIVWQDHLFAAAIQQPLMIKYILATQVTPLFDALFYGLKDISRANIIKSALLPGITDEKKVDGLTCNRSCEDDQLKNDIDDLISNSTIPQLVRGFKNLINSSESAAAVAEGSSHTARLMTLAIETSEIMKHYELVMKFHNNQDDLCLGYGTISHALDSRHSAAALHCDSDKIEELVNRIQRNENPFAAFLIKARLEQVIALVIEKREELNYQLEEIMQALKRGL